jgi:RNA polymerase sigma-70 factor (ECF subfamily)
MDMDEQDLINEFNDRSYKIFTEVHNLMYTQLYYFAFKIVKDKQLADMCAGDALLNCFLSNSKYETLQHLKNALYLATGNKAKSKIQSNKLYKDHLKRLSENLLHNIDIDDHNLRIDAETIDQLYMYADKLSPEHKEILEFINRDGYTYSELSRNLNVKERALRSRHFRAVQALKKIVNDQNVKLFAIYIMYYLGNCL